MNKEGAMALNITNRKADELTRRFAQMEGVNISDAVTIAMEEAIARRRTNETMRDKVRRVLKKHGIEPSPTASEPLPREIYDEMWGDVRDEH
jgi:antitoxin VapB